MSEPPRGRDVTPRLSRDSAATHYSLMSRDKDGDISPQGRCSIFHRRVTQAASSLRELRPYRHVFGEPRRPQRLGETREFAEQRTGLAGVDDLLDPELFGGTEWRAQLVETLLDLLLLGCGVIRSID